MNQIILVKPTLPDTYWLMEKLLDNMDRKFAGTLVA